MSSIDMIGSIKTTKESVHACFAKKGADAIQLAIDYLLAWQDAVPVGTQTLFAKMKCELSEEPCGCPGDAFLFKCKGPYLPVPVEIVFEVLFAGIVDGIKGEMLPAPGVKIVEGHMHLVPFQGPHSDLVSGPAKSVYVTKTA